MDSWLIIILCIVSVFIGLFVGRFWEKHRYLRDIQKLNSALDKIMRGEFSSDLSPYEEGELSILVNQLELVVKRTEHMVNQLHNERGAIHDFIADVSHQIKTPLTGLLTYLDLWESAETDETKKAQIAECIYLAERINELIRTLLELARLDAGSVVLKIETVKASAILQDAKETALAARPNADNAFYMDVTEDIAIRCDRKWFGQALVNIFVNAMDYSEDGGMVQVSIKQKDGITTIKVLDHGGGIAEADLKNIFQRFYRTRNAKKDGFGIGLSMAESIVNLHKGNIRAVNEEDGLAMYITLPQLPCTEHLTTS